MGKGITENRDDPVALFLKNIAFVPGHTDCADVLIVAHDPLEVFSIDSLGQRRIAYNIAKKRHHLPAFARDDFMVLLRRGGRGWIV